MPSRLKRPCTHPGCGELVSQGNRCQQHARQYEQERGTAAERGYDSRWQKIRAIILSERPLCQDCLGKKPPYVVAAAEVHHMKALVDGGTHSPENLRPLCKSCHSIRTVKENHGFGR